MPDNEYMERAIALARQGLGLTSPGAMVGAVVVKDNSVRGEGFYTWDGIHHAEVLALRQAGAFARGSTVYVGLEPCSFVGRSGRALPCARELINAGVSRVVAAMQDPNPNVNGRGLQMLRDAGIEVQCGLLEEEARRLNEAFITYKTRQRPFGILKTAMTLDGKIATAAGESQWITSEQSRRRGQELRHAADAIVTGSGTFLSDQPQMTDRSGLPRRRALLRVVMDRRGRIDGHGGNDGDGKIEEMNERDGWLIFRGALKRLTEELYAREVQSFLMECGPDSAFHAVQAGVIDKIVAFVAPRLLGGREIPAFGGPGVERLQDAIEFDSWSAAESGPDLVITAYVHRNY